MVEYSGQQGLQCPAEPGFAGQGKGKHDGQQAAGQDDDMRHVGLLDEWAETMKTRGTA